MEKTRKSQINFKNAKFGSDYYKKPNKNFNFIANSIKNICKNENPKSILDIGCGSGEYSKLFPNAKYTGLDSVDEIINFARGKGLNIIKCNIEEGYPVKDKSFDCVITMDTIEHVYDTVFHLKEAKRVLKEDGFIILITPNITSLSSRIGLLKGQRPGEVDSHCSHITSQDHIRAFGIEDIKQIFSLAGLKIEVLSGLNNGRLTGKILTKLVNMGYLVSLSSSFLVKARKMN